MGLGKIVLNYIAYIIGGNLFIVIVTNPNYIFIQLSPLNKKDIALGNKRRSTMLYKKIIGEIKKQDLDLPVNRFSYHFMVTRMVSSVVHLNPQELKSIVIKR